MVVSKVVVGIDGSDSARHALQWALDKASVLGPVTPVTAFELPPIDVLGGRRDERFGRHRASAEAQLQATIDAVAPELAGTGLLIEAHPGRGLVDVAAEADLLVVGTSGHSGLLASMLGSTSSYCADHATVPVVVVPPECPIDRPLQDVVVGVDGSAHADDALRWAIENTSPGGRIRAVGALPIWGAQSKPSEESGEELGRQVAASLERVAATIDTDLVDVAEREYVIVTAARDARVVLREVAADGADLLVVGRRGQSGLSFLLIGSVATALVHHPVVPTVVIPGQPEPAEREAGPIEEPAVQTYRAALARLLDTIDDDQLRAESSAAELREAAAIELSRASEAAGEHRPGRRLREALHRFETDHPDLTRAISDVSYHLSGLGI